MLSFRLSSYEFPITDISIDNGDVDNVNEGVRMSEADMMRRCGREVRGGARERKNVVLLFSKLPEPGKVKTRLTTLKDGHFEPAAASVMYHCMLFDVVEICMGALAKLEARLAGEPGDEGACGGDAVDGASDAIRDSYDLVISTAPAENLVKMERLFEDAGTWPRPITFIADKGHDFDEHYNDAFDQVWEMGADCILSMGCDMPALTEDDIIRGFEALHGLGDEPGIVLAPDQEMGVSVIGWNRHTDFNHTGVFYNQEGLTVLPAYIRKAQAQGLPAIWLPPIPDIDTMADLVHNITVVEALNYCEPFKGCVPPYRTQKAFEEIGITEIRVPPNDLMDPRDHIDR